MPATHLCQPWDVFVVDDVHRAAANLLSRLRFVYRSAVPGTKHERARLRYAVDGSPTYEYGVSALSLSLSHVCLEWLSRDRIATAATFCYS